MNKTFASIFFLESLTETPPVQAENLIPENQTPENMAIENTATGGSMPGRQSVQEKKGIKLEKAKMESLLRNYSQISRFLMGKW